MSENIDNTEIKWQSKSNILQICVSQAHKGLLNAIREAANQLDPEDVSVHFRLPPDVVHYIMRCNMKELDSLSRRMGAESSFVHEGVAQVIRSVMQIEDPNGEFRLAWSRLLRATR